ncbi:putative G-protein coupled receptor [Apostichopus japonicus]|uniref:Putative G-protein coupled receptor n=1 Tax=Stichopus japonicus TaxID=307972 RepID=A0A2G8L7X0_STIJA|nr:putative G-protein coupled receptor [Apostichopus japonicus]
MTVEAVNMYFLFVKYERSNIPHFLPISLALAYGLPLAPVLTVFFLNKPCAYYRYSCFLPNEYFLYLGFLLWLFLLVTANVVIFIMVIRNVVFRPILSTNAQLHKRREILLRIQQFALFWILLGLSWIFGFLSILPNFQMQLFEILFCLLTSLQGFVLFIFICLKNPEVRQSFKVTNCLQSGVTSNETNSSSLPLIG